MFKIISKKKAKMQEDTILRMVQSMTTQKRMIGDLKKEVDFLVSKLDESNKEIKKLKRKKK